MPYDFDAPLIWNDEEDKKLLGSLFPNGMPWLTNLKPGKTPFESPFGEESVFADKKMSMSYISISNGLFLRSGEEVMDYYYREFESYATIPIAGVINPVEPILGKEELVIDPEDEKNKSNPIIPALLPSGKRIDREYKDEKTGKYFFLNGKLNVREGSSSSMLKRK